MNDTGLHERLRTVVGDRTYRSVAEITGMNAETVRRYLQGQAPSVDFLARVCQCFDTNANWLLTGAGPRRQSETRAHSLQTANPGELLTAVSQALEHLIGRVDRIELFVQTLETRARAVRRGGDGQVVTRSPIGASGRVDGGASGAERGGKREADQGERSSDARARWIADAVPQRSPEGSD